MSLQDILLARGLADDPPSEHCSLLRACLHNLKAALDLGHLSLRNIRDLFEELLSELSDAGWSESPAHIDQVYVQLASILARATPALFFCREAEQISYLEDSAVSLQPSWAFKFWLKEGVHEARLEEHQLADVIALTSAFASRDNRLPDAKLGLPLLWLTPNVGAVAVIVRGALTAQIDGGARTLEVGGFGQRLRDLLGVERRYFPEHAVAAVTTLTIKELGESRVDDEVGEDAEIVTEVRRLAAPTQFDACDYPVFRHWPSAAGDTDSDYGRTWDLANDVGEGRSGGAPELISDPLPLDHISRLVPLGQIRMPPPSEAEKVAFASRFANELCGTETVTSLVTTLARRARI